MTASRMIKPELDRILETSTGEREVASFIERNPDVLRWAITPTGGHSAYLVKEFPFGSQYRADFVIPYSYSGMWEVHCVELEPPSDHVINKDGTMSQRLNKAVAQINEWRGFIEQNRDFVRRELARHCMERDLLKIEKGRHRPSNMTSDYLDDPQTHIQYNFHIIIGRRENITREQRARVNLIQGPNYAITRVYTYGRLQDIASNIDRSRAGESVYLPETAEDDA